MGFKILRLRHKIESISPLGRFRVFRKRSSDNPSIASSDSAQLFDLVVSVGVGLSANPIAICISSPYFTAGPEKAFGGAFEIRVKKVRGNIHFSEAITSANRLADSH
jgi:hypothetical protein